MSKKYLTILASILFFDNKWETLGSVGIDLESYYTKDEIDLINNNLRTWVTDNFASKTEFNTHKDNKNNPHGSYG